MSDYTKTQLTCNDMQQLIRIMSNFSFEESNVKLKDGYVDIATRRYPHEELKQISQAYPDLIFTAMNRLQSEMYSSNHIIEYKKGEVKDIGLEANYSYVNYEKRDRDKIGESMERLIVKAEEIYRRVDIVKEDEKGRKYIDFINNVSIKVQDEDFEMHLTKNKVSIEIVKFFPRRKVPAICLAPIEDELSDLPF
jgi:hypothetical protein